MSLVVRTERLSDDHPLLSHIDGVAHRDALVFVREGEGLVGWGTALECPTVTDASGPRAARDLLTDVAASATIEDDVGLPGTGLVAFCSFPFDVAATSSPAVIRIPATIVGRSGGVSWRTTMTAGSAPASPVSGPVRREASTDRPRYAGSTLDDSTWLESVAQALDAIGMGSVEKIVLARDVLLWSRTDFDIHEILDGLARRFPSCFTFLVDGLVGASPELLLRRRGRYVASRVLAGTARRGPDPEEDARLGEGLMASRKDRWEHDLAARSVSEVLGPLCDRIDIPDAPSLVRLENVQHLGSDLSGTLAGPTHILDILESLHPTAAVAGTPRGAALALIRELEGMDRGRYAGPVGWCDASGDGEFAIALRCAHIEGGRARLFAGAGVVEGSLPESELMETWLKLRAMTEALTRR